MSSLYGVARRLLASRDREEVLLELATATADALRAEIAGVFLASADGTELVARAVVGHRSVETARLRLAPGQGMVGHVYTAGEVYRSDDWTTDPVISKELLATVTAEGTRACIGAPLRVDGEVVGVLAAWRRRRSIYTDDDVAVIETLADLAALGVQRALAEDRLRELGDRLRDANSELARRYDEARQALEIHRRLVRVVADGADLNAVVEAVAGITGQEAVFAAADGPAGGAGWLADLVAAGTADRPGLGEEAVLLGPDGAGRHAVAVTVRSAGERWGTLAVGTGLPVAMRDVVAAEQAAVACALLLSRRDAVAGAARRVESELVRDLLDGRVRDEADLLVRSRRLARELPSPARVVLVSAEPAARRGAPPAPERAERFRAELARGCTRVLAAHGAPAPVGERGDALAAIIPDLPVESVRRLGRELHALGAGLGGEVSVGVSSPVHAHDGYPAAGRQAASACAASRPPQAPLTLFEDLGAVRFLLQPARGEDLDGYAEQLLGALLEYDRAHGTDLVETLRAYLRCDGRARRAAAELGIHPKTMSYRLGRIEAISGLVLTRQDDRFNAQLALQILAVRASGTEPE
ncbi:MAG TPA: helix-turn-helix domain-containing protein [Pseudonocardia sp.]|nr:helix-turn-helix domain-containing protein [Pseudonocardia sp.]